MFIAVVAIDEEERTKEVLLDGGDVDRICVWAGEVEVDRMTTFGEV